MSEDMVVTMFRRLLRESVTAADRRAALRDLVAIAGEGQLTAEVDSMTDREILERVRWLADDDAVREWQR